MKTILYKQTELTLTASAMLIGQNKNKTNLRYYGKE